ncbi:MAG: hypothetical protein WBG27_10810 [Candidatus Aquilonibacter sp.]
MKQNSLAYSQRVSTYSRTGVAYRTPGWESPTDVDGGSIVAVNGYQRSHHTLVLSIATDTCVALR